MRGTTAQRSPGTWRLRVVTGYDAEGRCQQLSRTVRGTRRQAQSALPKFVAEVGQGTAPLSGRPTFGCYLEQRWLPHADAVREPTAAEGHRARVNSQIKSHLGRSARTNSHADGATGRRRSRRR